MGVRHEESSDIASCTANGRRSLRKPLCSLNFVEALWAATREFCLHIGSLRRHPGTTAIQLVERARVPYCAF